VKPRSGVPLAFTGCGKSLVLKGTAFRPYVTDRNTSGFSR
jgi:hypothetical protein